MSFAIGIKLSLICAFSVLGTRPKARGAFMNWHNKSIKFAVENTKTDAINGLSENIITKLQKSNGKNIIEAKKDKPLVARFFMQFNDFMVLILLLAAALSFFAGRMHGEEGFADPIIILAIIVLNGILGMIQESRAKKAMQALSKMSQPETKVMRNGHVCIISVADIVYGDIVILETGTIVPADIRLIQSINLKMEEAALTGESVPIEKDAEAIVSENAQLGDMINMAFSGSYTVYGRGLGVVIATGMQTQIGKIATLIMQEKAPNTPLQKKLAQTGKILGIAALVICAAIFVIGVFRQIPPLEMFITSVSLAVAAIPEGLVAIVTIMLAIGTMRMAKQNAIIRKLPAVETLGSATIICSDKTGTLTQNKMSIVEVTDGISILKKDSKQSIDILKLGALCNDCFVENGKVLGNPTEAAFIAALMQGGIEKQQLDGQMQRLLEIPFDSKRKLMTTVHKNGNEYISITKGAPDVILSRCSHYVKDGQVLLINEKKQEELNKVISSMANKALRVLSLAIKQLSYIPSASSELLEKDLIFCGMVGMIDPPRPEVREAVAICKNAGITPIMITGDHKDTAKAIARQIGIGDSLSKTMTGQELSELSEQQLENQVEGISVFARVSPEHKLNIVKALQKNGHIVAMTGDGVNDAPALKAADIGCAMGINGTEVAKGAADMILTDDNFATIVHAIKEGRGILTNIKKAVHFLMSSNIGEIITIFAAILLGWQVPLLAIHLLWVNLVTDSLPAIALGLDPAEADIMKHPAKKAGASLFSLNMWQRIFLEGCMIGMLSLIAFGIGQAYFDTPGSAVVARTMAFATLSISQLVHAFNMRSEKSIFAIHIFENRYLVGAFAVGFILQFSVISIDSIATIFRVTPISTTSWAIVILLSLMPILIVELEKLLLNYGGKMRRLLKLTK